MNTHNLMIIFSFNKISIILDKSVDKLYSAKAFKAPLERVKHLFERYTKLIVKAKH